MEKEPSIVFQQNKKTGVVYAYENRPYFIHNSHGFSSLRSVLPLPYY